MRQSGLVEAWGLYERQLMCQAVVRLRAVLTWLFFSIAQMDLERKCSSSRGSISSTVGTSQSGLTFLGWGVLII